MHSADVSLLRTCNGSMCEPAKLWQDELNSNTKRRSEGDLEREVAKQGSLQQLSDQISTALREHAATLHKHLEDLLVAQEQRARHAETTIESMFREAVTSPSSPPLSAEFGLPGEVEEMWAAIQKPNTGAEPPAATDPPPPCEEFRVLLDSHSLGTEFQNSAGSEAEVARVLGALPGLIQSSLSAQEQWHYSCLEKWAFRQDGRRQQACARLENILRKHQLSGPGFGGHRAERNLRSEGLLHLTTTDTMSTPPTATEVTLFTPAETPKGATVSHTLSGGETVGLEVRPLVSREEQSSACYPALDPPNWRRSGFLLFEDSSHYILGRIISGFMVATIIVSTVSFVIETLPNFKDRPGLCQELLAAGEALTVKACEPVPRPIFSTLEAICIAIFSVEYALRLALCHTDARYGSSYLSRTFHYAIQPLNVVDVVAVLPFYLKLALEFSEIGVFGMLRLMRVCRLLKLAKHHKGIMICWDAVVHSGLPLALLFFYDVLFGIIFATIIHTLEGSSYSVAAEFTGPSVDLITGEEMPPKYPTGVFVRPNLRNNGVEPSPFYSIPAALWWVFATTTTVGYGDFAPTTTSGQCLGVLVFYFGIILLALPIGVVSQNFERAYERAHKGTRRRRMTSLIHGTRTNASEQRRGNMHSASRDKSSADQDAPPVREEKSDSIRKWIFMVLNDPNSSLLAMAFSYISFALIIVTTVSLILESMPVFSYTPEGCGVVELSVELCKPEPDAAFETIEVAGTIFFTVEYALRFLLAHSATEKELGLEPGPHPPSGWRKTLRYALQPLNVIDLVAVVPFYLEYIGLGGSGAAVLRVLRLVRVFRVLKSPKMRACVDMILTIVLEALPGIVSVFSLTCLVCIMFGSCMFFAEGTTYSVDPTLVDMDQFPMGTYIRPTKDGMAWEPTPFLSILHTVWWFFATATTVGYGDYVPTTTAGKLVAIFVFYLGIVLVAIKLTIVNSSFKRHYPVWQSTHSNFGNSVTLSPQTIRPPIRDG